MTNVLCPAIARANVARQIFPDHLQSVNLLTFMDPTINRNRELIRRAMATFRL